MYEAASIAVTFAAIVILVVAVWLALRHLFRKRRAPVPVCMMMRVK